VKKIGFLSLGHWSEAAAVGLPDADVKVRLGFSDDTWWQGFVLDDELWLVDGVPEGDGGTFSIHGRRADGHERR
jgi:hypothetical protein